MNQFEVLGKEMGETLKAGPLKKAKELWSKFDEESKFKAQASFYSAAEAVRPLAESRHAKGNRK